MTLTLEHPKTADLTQDGYFDGAIGLPAQKQDESYLKGYYEGLKQYLDW